MYKLKGQKKKYSKQLPKYARKEKSKLCLLGYTFVFAHLGINTGAYIVAAILPWLSFPMLDALVYTSTVTYRRVGKQMLRQTKSYILKGVEQKILGIYVFNL